MVRRLAQTLALALTFAGVVMAQPQERVDLDAMNRIRDEGLHRSQVMDTLEYMTDVLGPRLTASPEDKAAAEWARQRLQSYGLSASHTEAFDFGEGWSYSKASARMITQLTVPFFVVPKAWTPGTAGVVRGEAIQLKLETEEDLAAQKGKLKGKIVLLSGPREAPDNPVDESKEAPFERYTRADLEGLNALDLPDPSRPSWRTRAIKRFTFGAKLNAFLVEEGVVATIEMSRRDNGVINVQSGGSLGIVGRGRGVPAVVAAAEPYQRMLRLLDGDHKVELELEVEAKFHSEDTHGYNVVAEIPGTDKKDEVVMLGAHFDSWHAGTGATDNGAGSAVVMEAVRILEATGLKPRRTIRVALWSGEEQGLIGSTAYVTGHFASRPPSTDAAQLALPEPYRESTWPIAPKPDHAKLSAYFNLDNGSGRIRGIYSEENTAAVPIFRAWLEPLRDLGADTVTTNDTGGTDHQSFDGVGLPGFQFVQDALDYETRTHHSNIDTYDHARRDDLMQASVVMAAFVYDAAQRDERFPRKPLPQAPPKGKEKSKVEDKSATPPAAVPPPAAPRPGAR
ncbi:MAG: M20/M25/M40 family metallo-hydrolase [Acidobacteriota bacterium]